MMADTTDTTKRAFKRKLVGIVRSDKPNKTVVVEVIRRYVAKKYLKYVKAQARYQAHDENNDYNTGDRVEITEHRPISKNKKWIVTRLIAKAK
jgi:small subunit ribosomal protein S17